MNLHDFNIVVINSSGGKDSLCALWEINRLAEEQAYDKSNVFVSHQDLQHMEWIGTKELAKKQAEHFGFNFVVSMRRRANGDTETLLDYVRRRKKWPSNKQRYCTSDFKRGPGARVVTSLTKSIDKSRVLYIFGFRADESPARAKKPVMSVHKKLTTKNREVIEWLCIHDWTTKHVWQVIHENKLPYHPAYDLGMPRLSCVICIFSPFDALVLAGIHNRTLLDEYIDTEDEIGHTFRENFSLHEVRDAINLGYVPKQISNWKM